MSTLSESEEEEDAWSSFPSTAFLLIDDENEEEERDRTSRSERQAASSARRDWGIPTFQDQMDRGVRMFQLECLDDDYNAALMVHHDSSDYDLQNNFTGALSLPLSSKPTVIIHLEHRLHSTGSDLWDSALVLAHALPRLLPVVLQPSEWPRWRSDYQHYDRIIASFVPQINNMTVLELGSGTGAVGLYCAKCLGIQQVILTDQRDNLSLIRKNCLTNQITVSVNSDDMRSNNSNDNDVAEKSHGDSTLHSKLVSVCALDWTIPILPPQVLTAIQESGLDLIVGSDLFLPFAPDLLVHLAERLAQILLLCHEAQTQRARTDNISSDDTLADTADIAKDSAMTIPVAILAYEERFDCSNFFSRAKALDLNVEEIDSTWLHAKYQDPERIHVLRITCNIASTL